jgi:hypothetical protein
MQIKNERRLVQLFNGMWTIEGIDLPEQWKIVKVINIY